MKRTMNISLAFFLIMGAMVLFTGGTQANAEPVSQAWAGQWSCRSTTTRMGNYDFTRVDKIRHMTLNADGTSTGTDWMLFQTEDDYVGGSTYDFTGTVTDETYPTLGMDSTSTSEGRTTRASGRCIGEQFNRNAGCFTEATCIMAYVISDLNDYIEQFQCSRTVTPLP